MIWLDWTPDDVSRNPRYIPKKSAFALVVLTDESTMQGYLFLNDHMRISDLLNDDRKFLPLQTTDGSMVALSKASIKQVTLPSAEPVFYIGRDPYRVLGVEQGASLEEVKRAYNDLCKINDPHVVKSLGVSAEYQEVASKNLVRVNTAYTQVVNALRALQAAE
jgi:DnaJ-domain-containing protein 1